MLGFRILNQPNFEQLRQYAAKAMFEGGRIVNITSVTGQRAGVGRVAYGSSKGGVIALTKQMAIELGPLGINVNGIAPGPIETPMAATMHNEETRSAYKNLIPLGRYGTCEEVAAGAVFLASAEANYINGHILNIDGGYLAAGLTTQDMYN